LTASRRIAESYDDEKYFSRLPHSRRVKSGSSSNLHFAWRCGQDKMHGGSSLQMRVHDDRQYDELRMEQRRSRMSGGQ
jgi:hypothetical protein